MKHCSRTWKTIVGEKVLVEDCSTEWQYQMNRFNWFKYNWFDRFVSIGKSSGWRSSLHEIIRAIKRYKHDN